MRDLHLDSVQEVQEYQKVTPGGYICKITAVEDHPDKEYLFVEYDVADGKFKGYYNDLYMSKGFWGGKFVKSYKNKALPFFKSFTTAVENSNSNFRFDNDENKLVGKFVGLVLAEEEYRANDGEIKTRLYVDQTRSVSEIKAGNFKVPALKKLKQDNGFSSTPSEFGCVDDTKLPWEE